MSTLKATNIKNVSSGTNNLVLGENGGVVISGLATVSNANVTGGTITGVSTVGVTTLTVSNANITGGSITGVSTVSSTAFSVNGNAYPNAGPLSNRNLVINGAMQVAQRGTSVAVSDNSNEGYQSLDRYGFFFASTHGGACTISRSTTVPDNQGFTNSYKVDVTTTSSPTANQSTGIYTKIEAQDVANSGWNFTSTSSFVTLSFWARSTLGGTYCLTFDSEDAATYERYVHEYTLTADTWTKVEVQIPGKSTLAYNNDNGAGTTIIWILSSGSNRNQATNDTWQTGDNNATSNQVNFFNSTSNDFYLTGVQLEVGSVATPFEHRSYGQELALCQRYCEILEKGDSTEATIGIGLAYSATRLLVAHSFKVTKRASPSLTVSGTASDVELLEAGGGWTDATSIDVRTNVSMARIDVTTGSSIYTGGQAGELRIEGTSKLIFNCEL